MKPRPSSARPLALKLARMNLFSIAPGTAFLPALAEGVLKRHFDAQAPESLARVTILLPTRRAARALIAAFAQIAGPGRALLLPRILPIGDSDEEALVFDPASMSEETIPPAIPSLRRQLLLAREIAAFDPVHGGDDGNVLQMALAVELGDLIDNFHAEGTDTALLPGLVEKDLAVHWQQTLSFLDIALKQWPEILAREGMIDPGRRRDLLINRMGEHIAAGKFGGPVIAAGSTGTQPATAALLRTIAMAKDGAVVLPGLDLALDAESFDLAPPTHPQYALKVLLGRLGAARTDVDEWSPAITASRENVRAARQRLMAEALRPPETTHLWQAEVSRFAERLKSGFEGLRLIEADHAREEAAIIALAMRETLETEGATAALVTADRMLARRVAAELRRWDVAVDDSAGLPLIKTPQGALLMLALEAVTGGLAPVALMALLKNRLVRLGWDAQECQRRVRRLDRKILRGVKPAPGIKGLRDAIDARGRTDEEKNEFLLLARQIETALKPLTDLQGRAHDVADIATALAETLAVLSSEIKGEPEAFAREAGATLQNLLSSLMAEARGTVTLTLENFQPLANHLARTNAVRPRGGLHPRLSILGPLEARLISADRIIIGGLNEGVWPRMAEPDAFLSRPMRESLGLPQPERRIGQSAHDFAMLANAPDVLMTRARRNGDGPANPSRFVLRLKAIADCLGKDEASPLYEARLARWAEALDAAHAQTPEPAPAPRPPLAARPRRFSVTEIETHLRDPYAIYARHVLALKKLDALEQPFDARDKGNALHNAIERYTKAFATIPPEGRAKALRDEVRRALGPALHDPAVQRFWLPRLDRAMVFFLDWDGKRRLSGAHILSECTGSMEIAPEGHVPVEIRGRADRVEQARDGFAIFDYKTGASPSLKQARAFQPQVQLLALIAALGGMGDVRGAPDELGYLELKGGMTPGEAKILFSPGKENAGDEMARVTAQLLRLIAAFDDPHTPYVSRRAVKSLKFAGDYDHLARVAAFADGAEEGE